MLKLEVKSVPQFDFGLLSLQKIAMEDLLTLRKRIVEKISRTSDVEKLKKMDDLLESELENSQQIKLDDAQISLLKLAEEDFKNGRFSTDDEVRKMAEEWLK